MDGFDVNNFDSERDLMMRKSKVKKSKADLDRDAKIKNAKIVADDKVPKSKSYRSDNRKTYKGELVAGPVAKGKRIKYNDSVHPKMAYTLCAEHGFTYNQLARVFETSVDSIKKWVERKPLFKEMVTAGRDDFDVKNVEQMLLKRAMGFEYLERSVKKTEIKGKDLNGVTVLIPATIVTETTKYNPPDVKASTFWLTNRNRARWKMIQTVKVDGNIEKRSTKVDTADLSKMSVEQLQQLKELITASANNDGTAIPVECEISDEKKQIDYFENIAKHVVEAEYED